MSAITTGNLRLISQELLDSLDKTFRLPDIQHDTPASEIKWAAAQREVVEWIKVKAAAHQQVGQPDTDPSKPSRPGAVVRYGS